MAAKTENSSTFAIISVVDKSDDSNYWKDLKYADRILKFESGRLMSSTTTSHREFVLRMAMIVKSTTLISKAFDELDLDPEEMEKSEEDEQIRLPLTPFLMQEERQK